MVDYKWIKLDVNTPTDPKVRKLSASMRWTFIAYLCLANKGEKWFGYLVDSEGDKLTLRDRASYVNQDPSWLCKADKDMMEAGLLTKGSAGRLRITNYEKYQMRPSERIAKAGIKTEDDPDDAKPKPRTKKVKPVGSPEEDISPGGCAMCRSPKKSTAGVQFVMQRMHDLYRDRFGNCPTITFGRDTSLIKALLTTGKDENRIMQVYAWYLQSNDEYIIKRGYDIPSFKLKFDGVAMAFDKGVQYGGNGYRRPATSFAAGGSGHKPQNQPNGSRGNSEYSKAIFGDGSGQE